VAALTPGTGHARDKSLVIAVDGLRPDALEAAGTTHIAGLIRGTFAPGYHGAYSRRAQAESITVSGPGHSSILTGVHLAKHGVADNTIRTSATSTAFAGSRFGKYPDYFAVLRNAKPDLKTVRLLTWNGTAEGIPSGAGKTLLFQEDDAAMAAAAAAILYGTHPDFWADPDAMFVFFSDTDIAGHAHGFSPKQPEYLEAIRKVDAQIGQILTALRRRPAFARENWQIVLTSDHGGAADGTHGGGTPEKRTVPFLVAGKNVSQGFLQGRPQIVDVAPTVLAHLGVAVPTYFDGREQGREVVPDDRAAEGPQQHAAIAALLGSGIAVVLFGSWVRRTTGRTRARGGGNRPSALAAAASRLGLLRAARSSRPLSNS
jgi:hypothetical protein